MLSLIQRARESGKCPPSLLSDEGVLDEDGFDAAALKVMDAVGFYLQAETFIGPDFRSLMEKAATLDKIPGSAPVELKKKALAYRRCIILAIVGGTPTEFQSLGRILADGFLTSVKSWLDDVLASAEGGVDFLLHLLSNIVNLPVTKSTVKESSMGKAIGSIEKHRICEGTPNEAAIKVRVQQIKSIWHASVKARKPPKLEPKAEAGEASSKRPPNGDSPPLRAVKRVKSEVETKKNSGSAFSSLLKKMSKTPPGKLNVPRKAVASKTGDDAAAVVSIESLDRAGIEEILAQTKNQAEAKATKKGALRVKWADHFGGQIAVAQAGEGDDREGQSGGEAAPLSWGDRKKRDRMREKELLAKAKKSKLTDDDDDLDLSKPIQTTTVWSMPSLIPQRTDVTFAQLESPEMSVQDERMKTVGEARYSTSLDVPISPAPLSDVEQALDMTSQSSAVIAPIPFFVPQQVAPEPIPAAAPAYPAATTTPQAPAYGMSAVPPFSSTATAEFVQGLGLPLFLVGQPVQALQSLANSPGLLSTLVDGNGIYDQARLMSLVQTLSTSTGVPPPQAAPSLYQPPSGNMYGAPPPAAAGYGQPSAFPPPSARNGGGGFRGPKSDDGNLHVSGYGPGTSEAEIISCFAPYVRVDEVVMKATFSFVNTSDPANAQRAREALNGTLIGGMPVRINPATRKKDNSMSQYGGAPAMSRPSIPGPSFQGAPQAPSFPGAAPSGGFGPPAAGFGPPPAGFGPPAAGMPPGVPPTGMPPAVNVDSVRDDRGNPATKNLFIAGYGPGTTEHQLRDLVGQYAQVTGVVLKGSFSFVNTTDKVAAVKAREMLGSTMHNGGLLRINFAKETGRLGTSFDLTYGPNTGPNARPGPPPATMSYYGRSGF